MTIPLLPLLPRPPRQMVSRTLTVNGVSKSHAMTGWRLGYAGGAAMADCRHADPAITKHLQPQQYFAGCGGAQRLTTQPSFFTTAGSTWLDKRRQQVLGMIAATDGLSATAPQGHSMCLLTARRSAGPDDPWRRNPSQRQRAGELAIRTNPGGRFTRLRVWNAGVFAYCVCDRRWPANPSLPADSGRLRAIALKACGGAAATHAAANHARSEKCRAYRLPCR